ncbi:DUF262 domain-containing protein [Acidiphilium cryptum]|uniref:DUF262 domain-containing protein n=1 Tax=Acidiphilium cryptum (strain JF-5) TaxID=349163 RepID=A5FWM6_ACICJ|nr:DUF262 domain-containing protein [Acidiphilium cryptum]ABQ30008.1 protein of unknown function DUF262 [Acidiphilium cryptum JF-5]
MQLPQPTHAKYSGLLNDIKRGQIKIPQFQRDFVWGLQKSAALIDSIVKGYPVGTFIFWATKERLRHVRDIGSENLPPPREGETAAYVLDGQQRITSLYATLKGLAVTRESGQIDDFSKVYIDLEATEDDQIVVTEVSDKKEKSYIRLTDLLYGGLTSLAAFDGAYHGKLEEYKRRIESYDFPVIEVRDVPIDVATEIFTRINVGGMPLTLFEIMVAKTYDEARGFDLSQKFDKLVESLEPVNYETISDAIILQLIALILKKECKKQIILKIAKKEFIDTWGSIINALQQAVEHFRNRYGIPVSALLPYNALLVPFAYYFYHHPDNPSAAQRKLLEDFFWRASLGGRYSSSVESKLAQDIRRIDAILNDESPDYDWGVDVSPDFILENGWFNTSRSFVKAILCLYAHRAPKSFRDNSNVNISNNWLKQSNSKNYHHFFPKSYLSKKNEDDRRINNVVNITIVDDYLNKRDIGAKPPSRYMKTFAKENDEIDVTMKTHLIEDLDKFGIWVDDYDAFLTMRSKAISRELKKRIIARDIDKQGQVSTANDLEEEAASFE